MHRPPRRLLKTRHRHIVAPLAATLMVGAALGVGVAMARAGGARRAPRKRRLGLHDDELLTVGLRRMVVEQAELAVEHLRAVDADPQQAVHEARKAIKRIRTIVRLLEEELGEVACAREQAALRRAAEGLAAARDSEVMLATLDGLCKREPRLARHKRVVRLRAELARRRDMAVAAALSPTTLHAVVTELEALRMRASAWPLREREGLATIRPGLKRVYGEGRRRGRRAARARKDRAVAMHKWRKRVKDLRYASEALGREQDRRSSVASGKRSRGAAAKAEARWLVRLAERSEALGELLGEEHDLAVLEAWIEAEGRRVGLGAGSRRALLRAAARRRAKLRRRALAQGRKLYGPGPKAFAKRVERAHRRCSPRRLS
jgi:CHAD domain-containing protein